MSKETITVRFDTMNGVKSAFKELKSLGLFIYDDLACADNDPFGLTGIVISKKKMTKEELQDYCEKNNW